MQHSIPDAGSIGRRFFVVLFVVNRHEHVAKRHDKHLHDHVSFPIFFTKRARDVILSERAAGARSEGPAFGTCF